jgi:large subunit ribosomal protein L13
MPEWADESRGLTAHMPTYVPKGRKAEELQAGSDWFVLDASNQVLGRLATRAARLLIGKDKPQFTPYLDCGDHVIIINADKIRLTGNKLEQKTYYRHSGFPGGLKEIPAARMRAGRADWMVREAVLGMLPKNKLRARRARKLRIYLDDRGLARHAGQRPKAIAQ